MEGIKLIARENATYQIEDIKKRKGREKNQLMNIQ